MTFFSRFSKYITIFVVIICVTPFFADKAVASGQTPPNNAPNSGSAPNSGNTPSPSQRTGNVSPGQVGSNTNCSFDALVDVISLKESSRAYSDTASYRTCTSVTRTNGIPGNCAVNFGGCLGLFQFCPGTFDTIRARSSQPNATQLEYLNNPSLQREFFELLIQDNQPQVSSRGLCSHVGQVYQGIEVTESAILMGMHFLGPGETAACLNPTFSSSNFDCVDGGGTPFSQYISNTGGYDVPNPVCGASGSNGCNFSPGIQNPNPGAPKTPSVSPIQPPVSPLSPTLPPNYGCIRFCDVPDGGLGMTANGTYPPLPPIPKPGPLGLDFLLT